MAFKQLLNFLEFFSRFGRQTDYKDYQLSISDDEVTPDSTPQPLQGPYR
jgi:hypothetical protein